MGRPEIDKLRFKAGDAATFYFRDIEWSNLPVKSPATKAWDLPDTACGIVMYRPGDTMDGLYERAVDAVTAIVGWRIKKASWTVINSGRPPR